MFEAENKRRIVMIEKYGMRKRKCPICLSGGTLVHKGVRDNCKIDVYQCCKCGTKYLSVTDKENDYENGFMHGTDKLSEQCINEKLISLDRDDARRYNMVKDICINKRVLDFGCGFGGFLQYILEVAKSCCGVELGKQEREWCKNKRNQCFRTIDECEDKFDVITLFHVFEHLDNPQMWLNKFSEYLVEDGYLIIEVPNGNDVLLSLYESEKFADFTYWSAHLFLYNIQSLSMIIKKCDKFNVISAGQIQRYPLSNHLMWLAKGLPGGHNEWSYLDSKELDAAYAKKLEELEMSDTLFFILQVKKN